MLNHFPAEQQLLELFFGWLAGCDHLKLFRIHGVHVALLHYHTALNGGNDKVALACRGRA
ncbi:hypothetical protein D3C75_1336430 [compost metagenome]